MNYRAVLYYIGTILKVVALFLLVPFITSMCYSEWQILPSYLYTALIFVGAGFLFAPIVPKVKKIGSKEGLVIVGLSWVVVSLLGALPYRFSGAIPNYFNAVFETISGFTTTGATILDEIASLPRGILIWRSLTHWLGGMGILVFLLAVIPSSDGSTFFLMRFESPGPTVGKLVSKVRHSAAISYFIYLGLTVVQIVLLLAGGVSLFDSVNLTFSTAGTGGFAVRNDSAASYGVYVQIVLIIFMIIFSMNFNVYYLLIIGKISTALRNEEFISYLVYIVICIAAVTACTISAIGSFGTALLQSSFAVATVASTTGFTISDYAQWSEGARAILTVVTLIGSCAGSTGGGAQVLPRDRSHKVGGQQSPERRPPERRPPREVGRQALRQNGDGERDGLLPPVLRGHRDLRARHVRVRESLRYLLLQHDHRLQQRWPDPLRRARGAEFLFLPALGEPAHHDVRHAHRKAGDLPDLVAVYPAHLVTKILNRHLA